MKKIIFFSAFPLEFWGGYENYVVEITGFLIKKMENVNLVIVNLDKASYEVLCKILNLSIFYAQSPTCRYSEEHILKKIEKDVSWLKVKFSDLSNHLMSADIIYTKNEILELSIIRLIGIKTNKLIAGVHTPPSYLNTKSISSKIHNYLYQSFIYTWLTKPVSVFHTINEYDYGLIKSQFAEKKVLLIYNPFDSEQYKSNASSSDASLVLNSRWNFDESKFKILWVGRLTEQKGVNDLVNLIELLNKEDHFFEKAVWYIAGSGNEKEYITMLSNKYSNVNWLGHVSADIMPNLYSKCDIYISTSKWEGFPYTLLEAQAIGLVCIARKIPGCIDIVQNSSKSFLVEDICDYIEKIKFIFLIFCKNGFLPKNNTYIDYDKFNYQKKIDEFIEMLNN